MDNIVYIVCIEVVEVTADMSCPTLPNSHILTASSVSQTVLHVVMNGFIINSVLYTISNLFIKFLSK